ncbi:MAG: hypothetical protein K6C14_07050 [Eubacterium sp.]|nr:hypothetical protein [Eubacterium sp.]
MKRNFKAALSIILSVILIITVSACSKGTAKNAEVKLKSFDGEKADFSLNIENTEVHGISDMLYGVFFEDINFSADGGLYAEMIANRSFEFTGLAKDDEMYHWAVEGGADAEVKIGDKENALNKNNTNYLVISNSSSEPAGVKNIGFMEGMAVKAQNYNFSLYAKALDGYDGGITVRLDAGGTVLAEGRIEKLTDKWEKYSLSLASNAEKSEDVSLQVLIDGGKAAVDMVSLFPENTFKNRENGMRADLAGLLEDMKPRFLRFPGGCVIEGYDEKTAYDWKASVGADENGKPLEFNGGYGDVAARRQGVDLWTDINATDDEWPSFMSYGLGFFEYFQLAEDIGAVGVPVLNAGLYCQGRDGKGVNITSEKFAGYVDDMLDLVEFCRGGKNTEWGKVRCSLGHDEPFELKYICIGNENHSEVYYRRYQAFLDALNKAKAEAPELYKDIELIYSSGGDDGLSGGDAYLNSYKYAKKHLSGKTDATEFAGAVDAHYYNEPEWFLDNADYYDENNYQRSVSKMTDTAYGGAIPVFVGEYASLSNNMKSALSEAAYMTGLERNGDIVRMAAYAPLYSSVTARHWAPNLIWFNNQTAQPSVNYYVQKLFSNHAGSVLLKSSLEGASLGDADLRGSAGVGTWLTSAEFKSAVITDNETNEVLYQNDFLESGEIKKNWEIPSTGNFLIEGGSLVQTETETDYSDSGSIAYYDNPELSNYTYMVTAKKLGGKEGFFIPFAVRDKENMFFWNIGGWDNTVSCLQEMKNGKKSGQLPGTVREFKAEDDRSYELKITINKTNIKCYIDGELYIDYDAKTAEAQAYQTVSRDENRNVIIKLVNVTEKEKTFAINAEGFEGNYSAEAYILNSDELTDENVFGEKEKAAVREFTPELPDTKFNYTAPKYSVTVIVLKEAD